MGTRRTMDIPEFAEQLGISRNAAYEAVKRGDIPAIKIGRRFLIPADTVDRLLAEAAQKGKQAPPAAGEEGDPLPETGAATEQGQAGRVGGPAQNCIASTRRGAHGSSRR
jgi:excisionase family DNA binding protein